MISQRDIERKLRALKPMLSNRYNVEKTGYFGSLARNEQDEDSDTDVLVFFYKLLGWAFFNL